MNSTNGSQTGAGCSPEYSYSNRLDALRWSVSWIGIAHVVNVILMVIVTLSVVLHASCLIAIAFNKALQSRYNLLVVGLTLADIVTTGVIAPIRLYRALLGGPVTVIFCKVMLSVKIWAMYTSLFMITSIAVLRAIVVTRPFRPPPSIYAIIATIVISFVLSTLHAIKFIADDHSHYVAGLCNGPIFPCVTNPPYMFYTAVTSYFICIAVAVGSYATIALVNANVRNVPTMVVASTVRRQIITIKASVAVLLDVIVGLAVFLVIVTYPRFKSDPDVLFQDFLVGHFIGNLPLLTGTLHPIIYFYSSRHFRLIYSTYWRKLTGTQRHTRVGPRHDAAPIHRNPIFTVSPQ